MRIGHNNDGVRLVTPLGWKTTLLSLLSVYDINCEVRFDISIKKIWQCETRHYLSHIDQEVYIYWLNQLCHENNKLWYFDCAKDNPCFMLYCVSKNSSNKIKEVAKEGW